MTTPMIMCTISPTPTPRPAPMADGYPPDQRDAVTG